MIGEKKGDHKGEEKGKARGGKLWKSQAPVQIIAFGNGMNRLSDTAEILSGAAEIAAAKGLPCTITPEEIRSRHSMNESIPFPQRAPVEAKPIGVFCPFEYCRAEMEKAGNFGSPIEVYVCRECEKRGDNVTVAKMRVPLR